MRISEWFDLLINNLKLHGSDEVPIAAMVVKDGNLLALARNSCFSDKDPTAHAEIKAIRLACAKESIYNLQDCILFVTLEPCSMCCGAIIQANIGQVYFGAYNSKQGAVDHYPFLLDKITYMGGFNSQESSHLLEKFFIKVRNNNST